MKKISLIVMAIFMTMSISAQRQLRSSSTNDAATQTQTKVEETKSRTVATERYYGSHQGGFAISVNANPFLNYVGNMFNGTTNNRLSDFEGVSNSLFSGHTITGKYMSKDNLALSLGLGFDNEYNTSYRFQNVKDVDLRTNLQRQSTTAFMAKFGLEYLLRPGKRLQPIIGADVVYVHENQWTYSKVLQTVTDVQDKRFFDYYGAPVNKIGLIANVGVEYFLCPSISLGATISLGVAKQWNKQSRDTDINGAVNYDKYTHNEIELKSGSSTAGANVSLNFYF